MDALNIIYAKFYLMFTSPGFVNMFIDSRFFMILLVVFLMRLKYSSYRSMWLSALINIPGTFLHEFMHFFVGLVFNAKPNNFTIFPKRNSDGDYVMGSVGFTNIHWYNAIPAALAPLLLLPVAFYINRYYFPTLDRTVINYILYVLFQTILIENAIPSSTDFRVAGVYYRGVGFYVSILILWLVFF